MSAGILKTGTRYQGVIKTPNKSIISDLFATEDEVITWLNLMGVYSFTLPFVL